MIRRWSLRLRNTMTIAVVVGLALLLMPRPRVGHFVSTRIVLHAPGFAEADPGEIEFLRRYLGLVLDEARRSRGMARDLRRHLGDAEETGTGEDELLSALRLEALSEVGTYEIEMGAPTDPLARRRLRAVLAALEEALQRSLRAYLGDRLARIRGLEPSPKSRETVEELVQRPRWTETGLAIKARWEADLARKRLERSGIAVKLAALRRLRRPVTTVVEDVVLPPVASGVAAGGDGAALRRAEADLAEMMELYMPAHPKVAKARELVEDLRRRRVVPSRPASRTVRRPRSVHRRPSAVVESLEGRLALLDAEVSALEKLLADGLWKRLAGAPARIAVPLPSSGTEKGLHGRGLEELLRGGFHVLEAVPVAAEDWKRRHVEGFGWRWASLCLGCLLLLGALEIALRRRREARWPEVLRRLPVLAALPRLLDVSETAGGGDEVSLLAEMDPGDRRGDALRLLEARLRGAVSARRPMLLAMSGSSGVGQSVALAHLAIVMASYDRKVLLVDANMRNPRQHEIFHVENERGLSDLLVDEDPSDECIVETAVENLLLRPAGPLPPEPVELFSAPRCRQVFSALEAWADVILVDGAALEDGPESSLLATMADGTFFVTVPGEDLDGVAPVLEDLEGLGHRLVGVVRNRVPRELPLR